MSEDRVDCLVNHLHVTCLTLIRLKKEAVYGQDPGFLELLGGYLLHSRQLMDSHPRPGGYGRTVPEALCASVLRQEAPRPPRIRRGKND